MCCVGGFDVARGLEGDAVAENAEIGGGVAGGIVVAVGHSFCKLVEGGGKRKKRGEERRALERGVEK
jgi:hypothetical protein